MNIQDCEYIKGDYPFTKEEIRAVILKKLKLNESSKLISLGGDTLFTCLEASQYVKNNNIIIYEFNKEFKEIFHKNCEKFLVNNLELKEDLFFLEDKYEIDRMFVGNGVGKLQEIVEIFNKNTIENSIIVFKEITLEKVAEVNKLLRVKNFKKVEVICINISKNQDLLGLNMMVAENPVYIITGEK